MFISGTYLPTHSATLNRIAGLLPVRPINEVLIGAFAQHSAVDWTNFGVLAGWGAAAAIIGIRRFRWNPRPE